MPTKRKGISAGKKKVKKKAKGNVIAADKNGAIYYEVEETRDFRRKGDDWEFLIKWRNYDELTWEPESVLCDTAYDSAMALIQQREDEEFLNYEDKVKSGKTDANGEDLKCESEGKPEEHAKLLEQETAEKEIGDAEDVSFDWDEYSQIKYRSVERILVNAPDVAKRVQVAREAGVPVVLRGHKGWPQFAARWLKKPRSVVGQKSAEANSQTSEDQRNIEDQRDIVVNDSLKMEEIKAIIEAPGLQPGVSDTLGLSEPHAPLDLSEPYELDTQKMMEEIGTERVPIQRKRDKLGDDPNNHKISMKIFLEKCWKNDDNGQSHSKPGMRVKYLHQWQFPLSQTAAPSLCCQCAPLPNDILGMDLLRFWHEEDKYCGDSPYQYIFMGNEGTTSKLHADKGGLMITIAPIVGEKEIILVHRADGPSSLYHLDADLHQPDLHHYPLMFTARVWKTILKPGEILIMPQGTYHECTNITPCLSYSRFYLDEINLKAFFESCCDGDAMEIDHMDLLWNASVELHTQLSNYSEKVRNARVCEGLIQKVPDDVVKTVSTLRSLRNIAREVEIRLMRGLRIERADSMEDWKKLVQDIELSLHSFRYRYFESPPKLKNKVCKHAKELGGKLSDIARFHEFVKDGEIDSGVDEECAAGFRRNPYQHQNKLSPEDEHVVISDSIVLEEGQNILVKDHGFLLKGKIKEIKNMRAAYIKLVEFDQHHWQYIPYELLRKRGADETYVDVGTLSTGMYVYHIENGERYRAEVQSLRHGTFYKIALSVNDGGKPFNRWFSRESILSAEELKKEVSQSAPKSLDDSQTSQIPPKAVLDSSDGPQSSDAAPKATINKLCASSEEQAAAGLLKCSKIPQSPQQALLDSLNTLKASETPKQVSNGLPCDTPLRNTAAGIKIETPTKSAVANPVSEKTRTINDTAMIHNSVNCVKSPGSRMEPIEICSDEEEAV